MRTQSIRPVSFMVGLLALLGALSAVPATAGAAQEPHISLQRTFALDNPNLDIDGIDDERVNVDIAVLDTGIDFEHPELNVVEGTDCVGAVAPSYACESNSPDDGDDGEKHPHGTFVSTLAASIDNETGWVGPAAGARLWAVDVIEEKGFEEMEEAKKLFAEGKPWTSPVLDLAPMIAAVKWVTARANQIDVVNYSIPCTLEAVPEQPKPVCSSKAQAETLEAEITKSIEAGVVYLTGAGNWANKVEPNWVPSRMPAMITVSAMRDIDGLPGAKGPTSIPCGATTGADKDDTNGDTSGWGAVVDIAAPSNGCNTTAIAITTGAAAVLASMDNPTNASDVQGIRDALRAAGNQGWTDESPDGVQEPLLDLSDPYVFAPDTAQGFTDLEPLITFYTPNYGEPCPPIFLDDNEVSGGCVAENLQGSFEIGAYKVPNPYTLSIHDVDFDLALDRNGDGYAVEPAVGMIAGAGPRVACDESDGTVRPWAVDMISPTEYFDEIEMKITVGLRAATSAPGSGCVQQVITVTAIDIGGWHATELDQETASANVKNGYWYSSNSLWFDWS